MITYQRYFQIFVDSHAIKSLHVFRGKYKVKVLVCDKNDDVGGDASKSCSGLTSTSATMPVGTLECKIRTISHTMVDVLCRDLDIPIIHCGSIAPVLTDDQMAQVPKLLDRAWQNGVWDYEFLPREEILEMEPALNPAIKGGIYSPRDSQINQFLMVVAEAENAAENGVEFHTSNWSFQTFCFFLIQSW